MGAAWRAKGHKSHTNPLCVCACAREAAVRRGGQIDGRKSGHAPSVARIAGCRTVTSANTRHSATAMDDARRADLIARRAARQCEIVRETQVALLGTVPAQLGAAGAAYRLHHPGEPAYDDWDRGLVPAVFAHFDWGRATPTLDAKLDWDSFDREALPLVRRFVAARMGPDDAVLVVPSNGASPNVEVSAAVLDAQLPLLMRLDPFELWISGRGSDGADWLLELRHPHVRGIG